MKIVQLSTVHPRTDARIMTKQCCTLARLFETILVVADGLGPEVTNNVTVKDIGRPTSRRDRMAGLPSAAAKLIREEKPDIVHFHDPELIPLGLWLQTSGTRVIYDVHEDVPRDILLKEWIPSYARKPLALTAEMFERIAARKLSGIVAATPRIAARFPIEKTIVIKNLPLLDEFETTPAAQSKPDDFIYIGTISKARGVIEMIDALEISGRAKLSLLGAFETESLQSDAQSQPGWRFVDFHGFQNRSVVVNALSNAKCGICTLWPTATFKDAYPVKLFEYMSAAIPVILSDFPLWREVLAGIDCALFVDPQSPGTIANAMNWILDNPEHASEMGRNGRKAILSRLNWSSEASKLIAFYERLLATDVS